MEMEWKWAETAMSFLLRSSRLSKQGGGLLCFRHRTTLPYGSCPCSLDGSY